MKITTKGYMLAFVSTFFLATTAIFIRYLTVNFQVPAFVLAFWRDVFVVIPLFVVFMVVNPKLLVLPKNKLIGYAGYGLVLAFFNIMWTFSVEQNGAAVATVLVYTSAAFTAILGRIFLHEELGLVKILAVLISFAGCLLVSGAYDFGLWRTLGFGVVTGITAGFGYALYSLVGKSFANQKLDTWTTLFYTFIFAAFFLFLFNFIGGETMPGSVKTLAGYFWLGNSLKGWIVLFLLGAIPTVLGFGLYTASMRYLASSVANLVATTEPVFTLVIAYLFLGEKLTSVQFLGSFLILFAVVMMRLLRLPGASSVISEDPKRVSELI